MQKNFVKKLFFGWHLGWSLMKIEESGSISQRHGSATLERSFVLTRSVGAELQAGELAGANPAAARALFNRQSMTAPRR